MRRIIFVIPLILLFTIFQPVAAEESGATFAPGVHLRFEHLTIDDGLSQNAGLAMLQDRQGYLWIGSQDGLNRYDGYSITQFRHDPENPASLSYNSIIALYEDNDNFLWIGTWGGGLTRYDPKTGQFSSYKPDPANPASLVHPIVTDIYKDENGILWVGTLGGLDRFDPAAGQFTHFQSNPDDPSSLSSDAISVITPAGGGKLWVGTGAFSTPGAGLNLFDPSTGKARRFSASSDCLVSPSISDILPDSHGNLWISFGGYGVSGGGLDRYNPVSGSCTHFDNARTFDNQIIDNNLTDLAFDSDGALWITSRSSGVWYMSPGGQFIGIHHNPADPESLSKDDTFSILHDRSGVIWIGTLGAGINKLNLNTLQFRTYRSDVSNPKSLPSDHVGSFAQTSDGAIWLGTFENGLVRFNPAKGVFTTFRADSADINSLSSDMVIALHADPDGTLWVGTLGGGLNRFDPSTGKFTHYQNETNDPTSLLNDQLLNITQDPAGRLWVSSMAGLSRLDPGAAGFVNYPMPAPPTCFKMIGDELWMGTWGGGVYRLNLSNPANLDPSKAIFSTLKNDPTNPNSLSQDGVWTIYQSADGLVWIGTEGGLNRYDPKTGQFKIYTTKNGLRNDTILGILQDKNGFLWTSTNNGLEKFDPRSETFQVYDKSDGLQDNEYNSNGYFQSKDGEFYFGGVSGFTVFDPIGLRKNETPPPVVITDFSIFNVSKSFDPSGATPIYLNYDQNFISFEFAALDYHSPRQNQYTYKLEGFDKDWVKAGTRNYASYTNLPGGNYTFRVQAANSDGIWNETGTALKLAVTPPFWQTWQFQVGVFFGLALLVGIGFQWRMQSVRQQNTRLQKMVDEQKRVETELRQSEARFRAMFENSAVGIGLLSLERTIIDANPAICSMLGYTREELIGQTPDIATHPDDSLLSRDQFQKLITGETGYFIAERRYVRKNGEAFWIQISMNMVRDADGKPLYLIGLVIDIDFQKRAAEQLAAQEANYRQMLEQRIAERTEELNLANDRLRKKTAQDAVIAERTRLARDLHDAVTQTLFSTTLIADVLPDIWAMNPDEGKRRLEEVRQLTRGALAEMRTLLVELRPNALVEVPLPTLLRQLTEALTGRSRVNIQLSAEGERKLPADVQVGLYRLAQEALNNLVKHAKATQAVVTLRMGDTVRLTVADNGVGFDPSTVTADHLGLKIMRERAETIGAKFSIYSEPGEGTQISIIWQ